MRRIFGFDIGTTSVGFAVIDHDPESEKGTIHRMGVRIFPEARDPDGTPLNQQRRQKRLVRRHLRRRRARRRLLNEKLAAAGLLPRFGSSKWEAVMATDPYSLRSRALREELGAFELGRALYHLAQRRHFRGRDLEEAEVGPDDAPDEKEAASEREATIQAVRSSGRTLGEWLAKRDPHERRRGVHAHRIVVRDEFERVWATQSRHHGVLRDPCFKAEIEDAIFAQRPVFWRTNTLGHCRFMPEQPLCPRGSWLSQQRRMLEKLNNLAIAGGNVRPLDPAERAAILERLQTQASMSWAGVRAALKPLYKDRGEPGLERSLKLNLELGGERALPGNAVEAKLASIFGDSWGEHPHKQAIREAVHERLWSADYGRVGEQRVVILSSDERKANRVKAAQSFADDFGATPEQAAAVSELHLPSGWEPYSIAALRSFITHLENGTRFGALVNGPEWEEWRDSTFPNRDRPTGEFLGRLPSPADMTESRRIASLRNPTVVRTQNELRKVVNNLIALYGKPDLIRVEVAREVGKSKREREEMGAGIRRMERRRRQAARDLEANGIAGPSRDTVGKWLLWKEGQERCPYTGDQIGFDALFRRGEYEVEHIWPRSRSFDDSIRNKTLCRKDVNIEKGDRTPYEYLGHDIDRWSAICHRLQAMTAQKGGAGMPPGKMKRFLAESMPDDFAARQLNDTGYAARQAVSFLQRLWPDVGPEAPVTVQAVTGRVTAQLRKLWVLNNILADDGEKTRADHRHHAIDALTIACTHPGMTNRLSRYWQAKDDPQVAPFEMRPPWPGIRAETARAVADIVVSHRVRRKVSGPLHKETVYGDTNEDVTTKSGVYRQFVTRKRVEALTKGEIAEIRDPRIREIIKDWVAGRGGDPKKAFPPYPRLGEDGPEIRRVRLTVKQQKSLMAPVSTGYADLGANHHIAIFGRPDGKVDFEVVSLFEAARRLARREPVVRRTRSDGAVFVTSLAPGEALHISAGTRRGLWVVTGVWGNGQIVVERLDDAIGATTTRPAPGPLILKDGAKKIAIDPIGRIRSGND